VGTTNNNGNLLTRQENVGGPGTWSSLTQYAESFGYDSLNRLTSSSATSQATCNGTCWLRNYQYDQSGNMWVTANGGLPAVTLRTMVNSYNSANQRVDES
jgi:hypothetical protein